MKKLLASLTLLFLVACQPSELERCIVANTEPTPINNYIIKHDEHSQTISEIMTKHNNDETFDYSYPLIDELRRHANSLNALEKIVDQCYLDTYDADDVEGLTVSEQEEYSKEIIQSCMSSTENEVKELQLEIEAENTEKAKSICHSQGIY